MGQTLEFAETETAPRDIPVTDGGVAFDLTGATISLILYDSSETIVSNPGTCAAFGDPALGVVRFTPANASVLLAAKSPYRARIKVTKSGADYLFPNDAHGDRWIVGMP